MPTPTTGTPSSSVPSSGYASIDALADNVKWGGALGTGAALTFSFASSSNAYAPGYGSEPATFHSFSEVPSNIAGEVRQALTIWSDVANFSFTEVAETSQSVGDLRFAYSSLGSSTSAEAYFPGRAPQAGDVWLSWDVGYMKQDGPNNYMRRVETITHEIGHAVGLKHPFEGAVQLPPDAQNNLYSVMSYTDVNYPNGDRVQDASPMLYDILAVQYLYGANSGFHAGDDTWTVGQFPQYGSSIDASLGVRATIWDGGGVDTLVTNSSFSTLDLRQGGVSYDVGESVIAFNTIIENATGGPGRDFITGNEVGNVLKGLGDADTIAGSFGDDWLEGESGNDPLPAGQTAGNDTLDGGAGNDTMLAGDGNDQVSGGDGIDVLVGEGGDDLIYGGSGIDYMDGRQGSDQLMGGDGNDILFGDGLTTTFGFSSDTLHGENGDDIIMGESGDHTAPGALDALYGDDGNDLIYGGAGDDFIYGGNGSDIIDGGNGNDYVAGGGGADILVGSGDSSNVGGPAATTGNDTFVYTSMADAGDIIYGFDTRAGNTDSIDLRPLFDALGYTGTTARADGFLTVTTGATPSDAVVWVDANGGGNSYVPLLTVAGVAPEVLSDAFFQFQ